MQVFFFFYTLSSLNFNCITYCIFNGRFLQMGFFSCTEPEISTSVALVHQNFVLFLSIFWRFLQRGLFIGHSHDLYTFAPNFLFLTVDSIFWKEIFKCLLYKPLIILHLALSNVQEIQIQPIKPLTSTVLFTDYGSRWLPSTVWLPTFFKISPFVLNRVWNRSKWWQNFHVWWTVPLIR